MAQQSWNDFIKNYPSRATFCAAVSASLPPAAQFDKNGKKLPSPYGLFNEWAKSNLTGDWSSSKVSGGFYLAVSERKDATLIQSKFGFNGTPIQTPASRKTQRIGYSDPEYAKWAKMLGYAI
ncbi:MULTISPECIES: hypothetical protein [Xanthomonas]|uniref:hypothetical protein n=1 Tax=Xanthomonas TaxID=338 RepID=UPI0012906CF1|nr:MULTISPECIES: hypothetical protein [Xanthomonas]